MRIALRPAGEPHPHAMGVLMRRTHRSRAVKRRRMQMLGWALVFLVVALIAGLLGFTGLAVASAGIAQILFYIFVVLFVVSSLIYLIRGRAPPTV
jgi:uncharacterized membrane protein YtjA (UPF0391 family)